MLAKARLVRADEHAACLLALPPLTADQVQQYVIVCAAAIPQAWLLLYNAMHYYACAL